VSSSQHNTLNTTRFTHHSPFLATKYHISSFSPLVNQIRYTLRLILRFIAHQLTFFISWTLALSRLYDVSPLYRPRRTSGSTFSILSGGTRRAYALRPHRCLMVIIYTVGKSSAANTNPDRNHTTGEVKKMPWYVVFSFMLRLFTY
jgi:hypothetical protein